MNVLMLKGILQYKISIKTSICYINNTGKKKQYPILFHTIPVSYTHLDVYKRQILFPANKNNSTKEKNEYLEMKTKEIRKIYRKKIINTREELEMMKNGLLTMFNLPMTDHAEMMNFKNNRRNVRETLERNHYNTCLLYTSRCV